ncbi:MAG: outer membrane protein transport protein [Haliea sp.]|nr:outer membrane protein transport protein [Haliea sp.]
MKNTLRRCTIAAAILSSSAASAGGLWLNEFGDLAGGRAAAGAAAGVDSAMTLAYNPASITRLEGNQLFASAGAIVSNANFDVQYTTPRLGENDGGNAGDTAAYGSMAYVHDFDSDKWSTGIALVPLAAAALDYNDYWVGRNQATKVDLQVMALSPTIAYRVTDKLSVGASLQAVYSNLNLHFAVPRILANRPEGNGSINGDDVLPGFTLGAMYELSERTRFGLSYQSEVEPKFDGDLKTNPAGLQVSTDTKLPLGEYVRFSVHQAMDERWSVEFTTGWDNWSALGNVLVDTDNRSAGLATSWKDTYHVAWGTEYKLDNHWTLTGGVAYDTNPVSDQNRNAQLPVDKQIRYAVGAQYALMDSLTVGGYVNYADLGAADIKSNRFGGEFDYNNATQIIANVNWTF